MKGEKVFFVNIELIFYPSSQKILVAASTSQDIAVISFTFFDSINHVFSSPKVFQNSSFQTHNSYLSGATKELPELPEKERRNWKRDSLIKY